MNRPKELLVTGGAGFIGSNFIELLLNETTYNITNVDFITYAGNQDNLKKFENHPNYRFMKADISNQTALGSVFDRQFDAIINFAAESHVDRSIQNAMPFIDSNIKGTLNLLHAVLDKKAKKMIQISTDEVYGSLQSDEPPFTEETPLAPNNPYSASKASADLLVRSFYQTYRIPLIITRCSNNYGPNQHTEKFIPKIITNALQDKDIPLYGDGLNIRDWLYVEDHCRAVLAVLENGESGEVYNIGGGVEKTNLDLIEIILEQLGKPRELMKYVADRKGHDRRYAMNWDKIHREIGWEPRVSFEEGIVKTINWYKESLGYR